MSPAATEARVAAPATGLPAAGRFTVVATDKVKTAALQALRDDERFEVLTVEGGDELREALRRAHGLIVRSATQVDRDLLDGAPELRVVGRAGVGVDNIDLAAATERGVAVLNAPAGNTVSAAELTLALILATVRKVAEADRSVRSGEWVRSRFGGIELRGKTLGLVGAGRIGSEVGRRARAFGMDVVAHDPYLTDERADDLGFERVSFEEVLERSDVVSLHVPLTAQTRGLLDARTLRTMKPSAFLVNVARGGVVDEAALVEALEEGVIAGAALDVFEEEPLQEDSPLRRAPNLVLTPHLGASTSEAQELVAGEIAEAVRAALAEGDLSRALNAPAIGSEALRRLQPILKLGRTLGRLGCVLAPGGILGVDVRYAGEFPDAPGPLASNVLMGLLGNILGDDQVNFVNAPHLAEVRGIGVSTHRLARRTDYTEFVELVVRAERGETRVAGALLGERHARLVRVDDYHVDVEPQGSLLVLRNRDVPGVIGRVGTLLGEMEVNIAEYHQARLSQGGEALAAVAVDGTVSPAMVSRLREVPEILDAWVVELG
ncbi:MAG: phosphoglycerate dehydrogenase [Gemmatimonadetes bacterium]|nr:phosphoglycerate dehydrogenase [Gemmatimonadota bacterium]